jgi:REP element-mobilizing transposase RayT
MKTRKHIRLRNFDYSSQAWYFITICTKNRKHTFGEIENGQMHLSAIGVQADLYWNEIPKHFPHIELGEFIIMPNHIHGIIGIVHTHHSTVRTRHGVSQQEKTITKSLTKNRKSHGVSQQGQTSNNTALQTNQFGKTIAGSLSAIIGQFKSTLTRWSRKNGHENFAWQGRFHDHIIRNDGAFQRISDYIKNNPSNWHKDKFSTH